MSPADPLEGDWYLHLGDQPFDPDVLPRYSLRGGRVFVAKAVEPVGSYNIRPGKAVIAIGGGEILTVGLLAGTTQKALPGTLTGLDSYDQPQSEPAMLLRAIEDTVAH